MINFRHRISFLALSACIFIAGCRKDSWDKRSRITDPNLRENLMQAVSANPDLSQFASYLAKTGYDKVIASSKNFTVWAPTNEALKNVPDSEINDTARLRMLVENHIANQMYLTSMASTTLRIKTLSGKYIEFSETGVNDANIVDANKYTNNGVLHTIDKALIPEPNIWELLNTQYEGTLQQQYINSLQYLFVDPDSAEQIGVDPQTGVPIYQPGTGLVSRNRFLQKVNLDDEDSLLTYIILTNSAYAQQKTVLTPYFTDTTEAQTDSITQWNIVKDLAFVGAYSPDSLPSVLYSANDSVQFHLSKGDIVQSQKVSNGMVYVVNAADYDLDTKIKPIKILGPSFLDRLDATKAYTIRTRRNPSTDTLFNDIYLANYGLSAYWFRYPVVVNSTHYKVYWMAVNDFQTGTFPMRLAFKSHTDTAFADPTNIPFDYLMPYQTVNVNDYSEVYLGEYDASLYGNLDVFLIGNNVTTNGSNTIVLNYIKLVPILN